LGIGGFFAYRRVMAILDGLETRQIAPAMVRVHAILDDVKGVTATVRQETERVDHAIHHTIDRIDDTADRVRWNVRAKTSPVMGLLTGTVLGAGLGMLFAPKSGSEMRNQISELAGNLANTASEGYRKASESASQWADRGKDLYEKTRDAVSRGADEAQRYVRD